MANAADRLPDTTCLAQARRAAWLEHVLTTSTGVFPAPTRSLRKLRNGVEIFPAMLDAIESARESIAFVTFVYWTGEIAQRFADALAKAARRGVAVRVVLDSVGAREMDDGLIDRMREAGAEVRWFRPLRTWRVWQTTHRTHRKLLIVDCERAFTGGVGIAKEWEGDARDASEWRDTHFELTGPVTVALWGVFVGTWIEAGGEPLAAPERHRRTAPAPLRVHVLPASARVGWSVVATALWGLIQAAESSIKIATAYFIPDEQTIGLLCERSRAGVVVDVLIPGPHSDARVVQIAAESRLCPLLEAGVRVHAYQPTMMHTKLVIIDETLVCFGSANINSRSLRKDEEVLLGTTEPTLVDALLIDFAGDLSRCSTIELGELRERPWWRRALTALLAPFRSEI